VNEFMRNSVIEMALNWDSLTPLCFYSTS